MVPENYNSLIEQCVAEVERSELAAQRRFKPPANPMRAGLQGAGVERRKAKADRPTVYSALNPASKTRGWRTKAVLGLLSIGIGVVGIETLSAAKRQQQAPPASAPAAVTSARPTPEAQVALDIRDGESCHQMERDLMSSFQNPNGSFYTQSEADAVIERGGATC